MSDHPTPQHILQIGLGFWPSKVLLSAVEMGLFTELARRPRTLKQLLDGWGCIRAAHEIFSTHW